MDSHFFRHLAAELEPQLAGRRIQKVFSPAADVQTLDLGNAAAGRYLLLRHGNKEPLFFQASEKPRNPDQPDAHTMWLRKRLMGRRLRSQHCDWAGRRLVWELSGQDSREGRLLLLCLRHGLSLRESMPQDFGSLPTWPDFNLVRRALADDGGLEVENLWREHPQLTPALRKTLDACSLDEARELYVELQAGHIPREFYVYIQDQPGQSTAEALAWRLPLRLRQGRDEHSFPSALEAAAHAGAVTLFSRLAREEDSQQRTLHKKAQKRLKRGLAKMDQEERRLRALTELRNKGRLLQAAMWRLEPERKLHVVEVPDFEQADAQGVAPEVRVELDPSLSVAANMERFFRLAAKGERGLPMAAARRQALHEELDALRRGRLPQREQLRHGMEAQKSTQEQKRSGAGKKKDLALQRFRTSDGFLLLRGRNKAANHKLVSQVASPYDLWFHAQDGPGAHLVLKRDHPRQEPPRQSLLEAAALAGLKGWQAADAKARVICALIKDVRTVKGADLGRVAVDKVLESFLVELDPQLEEKLRLE